jgi:hypothetical protein
MSAFGSKADISPYPEDLPSNRGRRDYSGVDIIGERAIEYVSPNENSDPQLSAITTGKRTVRSPRFRDWGVWPMTVGRFKAHVSSRIFARRTTLPSAPATALRRNAHHNRNRTQAPNGIRSLASVHDK